MAKDSTHGNIKLHKQLLMHFDGGCEPKNPGGVATSGWVIYDSQSQILCEESRIVQDGGPLATNNYGEFCALHNALEWLVSQNWKGSLEIKADSKLAVEQITGNWKCNAAHLKVLRGKIWDHINALEMTITKEKSSSLNYCSLTWIPRKENEYANDLARQAYQNYILNGSTCN